MGTRILTVEDDERIRTAVKMALEDEGWIVGGGRDRRARARAFNAARHVVLIDSCSRASRLEVCRSIRRTSDVRS